ncbi:MAG: hypothetical protein AAFQ94_02670 [Bacteroidota bacterium]
MKYKNCPSCGNDQEVMYRIQVPNLSGKLLAKLKKSLDPVSKKKGFQPAKEWFFVCQSCLPDFQKLPDYKYGGTWKGYRH